jgi:hypothetical protein
VTRDQVERHQASKADTVEATERPIVTTNIRVDDPPVGSQTMPLALGDQSLIDGAAELVAAGFVVDALNGRTFQQVVVLIEALPEKFPNVVLVDWDTAATECRRDCFGPDGIQLAQDGRELFADLIAEAAASQRV